MMKSTDVNNIYNTIGLTVTQLKMSNGNGCVEADFLLEQNGQCVVGRKVERRYHPSKQLYNQNRSGKVVDHCYLFLSTNNKCNGLGKSIHNSEYAYYKSKEFNEIHTEAAYDGITFWPRMNFNYVHAADEKIIKDKLRVFLYTVKGMKMGEISTILKANIKDIDPKYFKHGSKSFSDMFVVGKMLHAFRMYRVIS